MGVAQNRKLYNSLVYAIFALLSLIIIFPMYLTIVTAFKTPVESAKNFFAPPSSLFLGNLRTIILETQFPTFLGNSLVITVLSTVAIITYTPLLSYAIARNLDRTYYKLVYSYILSGIFVPFYVVMIPLVILMGKVHLMNQGGLIVLNIAFGQIQAVFLYVGYIRTSIPKVLEESAYVDGASTMTTFFKIVYPLITPMTATVLIVRALFVWNDFLLPLLILNRSRSFWTLPLFQYNFREQYSYNYNLAFSTLLMSIIPVIVVYVFSQKYIISGLTKGAMKG